MTPGRSTLGGWRALADRDRRTGDTQARRATLRGARMGRHAGRSVHRRAAPLRRPRLSDLRLPSWSERGAEAASRDISLVSAWWRSKSHTVLLPTGRASTYSKCPLTWMHSSPAARSARRSRCRRAGPPPGRGCTPGRLGDVARGDHHSDNRPAARSLVGVYRGSDMTDINLMRRSGRDEATPPVPAAHRGAGTRPAGSRPPGSRPHDSRPARVNPTG